MTTKSANMVSSVLDPRHAGAFQPIMSTTDLLFRVCVLLGVQHFSTWLSGEPSNSKIMRYVVGAFDTGQLMRDRLTRVSDSTKVRYGMLDSGNARGYDRYSMKAAEVMLLSGWQKNWVWDTKRDTNKQKDWYAAQPPIIQEYLNSFYAPDIKADHVAVEVATKAKTTAVVDPKPNAIPGEGTVSVPATTLPESKIEDVLDETPSDTMDRSEARQISSTLTTSAPSDEANHWESEVKRNNAQFSAEALRHSKVSHQHKWAFVTAVVVAVGALLLLIKYLTSVY